MMIEARPTFEEWLDAALDRRDLDPEPSAENLADDFIRFHENAALLTQDIDDESLGEILRHLHGSGSCYLSIVARLEPSVRMDRFFESVRVFYRSVFEARCSRELSHLKRAGEPSSGALNGACYMMWDATCGLDCFFTMADGAHAEACASLLEDLAGSEHPAVVESAIHGLGHMIEWDGLYERGAAILRKVRQRNDLLPDLLRYADDALLQNIQ